MRLIRLSEIGLVSEASIRDEEGVVFLGNIVEWSDGELTDKMTLSLLKLCVHLDHLYSVSKVGGHKESAAARLSELSDEAAQLRKEASAKEAAGMKTEAAELLKQAKEKVSTDDSFAFISSFSTCKMLSRFSTTAHHL